MIPSLMEYPVLDWFILFVQHEKTLAVIGWTE